MIKNITEVGAQQCFRIGDYVLCNWVKRGEGKVLVRENGKFIRFLSLCRKKGKKRENKQKEKAPVVEN